jgi:SAM-dependent methyltransferase
MNVFQGKLKRYSAGKVLDFGTGAGASVRNVIDAVKDFECVTGLDTTRPEQDIGPDLLNHPRFRYIQHNDLPLPFESFYFDTVCMSHVLHNLPLPSRQATIYELLRVLKPGGYFLFVEGYRDQQSGARKTQIYFHFLRAIMDSDAGIHHYPTPLRADLVELIDSLGFEHCDMFDFALMRQDFKDRANLDNIARFIDYEIERRSSLPRYEKYHRFGELLKKRMYRTGYLGSKVLVAICH